MLKASCNRGDMEISMKGDVAEIGADILTIINSVYKSLAEDDVISAEMFSMMIIANIYHAFIMEGEKDE